MPENSRISFLQKATVRLMRLFYHQLYHTFAWSYDMVASTVSLGRWKEWVRASAGLLVGASSSKAVRVLELGCGPGHLQAYLASQGVAACGLEESPQMLALAKGRLADLGFPFHLARGKAQHIPFPSEAFSSVVATFPPQFIFDVQTLAEVQRVLVPGGQLVVLIAAWLTGHSLLERAMRWLYRITCENPPEDKALEDFLKPFVEIGFQARLRFVEKPGSRLMFIIARKNPDNPLN